MQDSNVTRGIGEADVETAIASLGSSSLRARLARSHRRAQPVPDPVWDAPDGRPMHEHVRDQLDRFKKDALAVHVHGIHGGVFHRRDAVSALTTAHHHLFEPVVPTARDLLHVYGPDRNGTKDWTRFYRYAWTDKGPNGIIYSDANQIVREGKLGCNSYAYSGQSSFAVAGAGMFFLPEFGDAHISIRPYVQWLTTASFTGTESAPASARALLGIYVESWARTGGAYNVDRDHWITAWSQNTTSYTVHDTASGTATVGDGLSTDVLALSSRKYAIYVYAWLETTAGPQQAKNELRFVTIDIDAVVPFVVVQETLA